MFKGFGNTLKTIFFRLGTFVEHAGGEAVGKIWAQQTERVIKEHPRRDVIETIRRLEKVDPAKAEILTVRLDRAARTREPDFENEVVASMGNLLPRNKEHEVRWDEAVEIFEWLADKDDAHFAVVVEAMKHDPVVQLFRYWVNEKGIGGLRYLTGFLFESARLGVLERVPETARRIDHWAANTAAPAILQFRMNQRWLKRSKRRQKQFEEKWMSRAIRYME
mgnify:FL=1